MLLTWTMYRNNKTLVSINWKRSDNLTNFFILVVDYLEILQIDQIIPSNGFGIT